MLRAIGVSSLEDLLKQVPEALRWRPEDDATGAGDILGAPRGEMEVVAEARRLAAQNVPLEARTNFLGAGVYRHYIPSVVPSLATRAEFLTAYTPYQPEASQGLLQAIFEYQTCVARLTDMEVSNAGLYDGATALAEGVLMAMGIRSKARRVVLSKAIHPQYRAVVRSHVEGLRAEVVEVDMTNGRTGLDAWCEALGDPDTAAVAAFQSPNFFGSLEDGEALVKAAQEKNALAATVFNPIALGILATPGRWGADIAVAEGQPLGMNPYAGGEALGVFATRKDHMWKMPGRLVGLTRDRKGRRAYVLTLQSREQHIRRARATSNICTNQSLFALMAAIYLATLGPEGLREVATLCASRAAYARKVLGTVKGYNVAFDAPAFHEFVLRTPGDAQELAVRVIHNHNLVPGYPLGKDYPELADCLLVCTTEMTSREEIDRLAAALANPGDATKTSE